MMLYQVLVLTILVMYMCLLHHSFIINTTVNLIIMLLKIIDIEAVIEEEFILSHLLYFI